MDKQPHMKAHYIAMDNTSVHTHESIERYIKQPRYKYVYLLTYSPEFNPVEQFCAVTKGKAKRRGFLQEDTLSKESQKSATSARTDVGTEKP